MTDELVVGEIRERWRVILISQSGVVRDIHWCFTKEQAEQCRNHWNAGKFLPYAIVELLT